MTGTEIGLLVKVVASCFALGVWAYSVPGAMRLGVRWVTTTTLAVILAVAWYAFINVALFLDVFPTGVPAHSATLSSYAFPLLVVAPALRNLAYRPLVKQLEGHIRGDSQWKKSE